MLRWNEGRAEVESLLGASHLQRVHASAELAEVYLEQSRQHLLASERSEDIDPFGSFQLAYDAAAGRAAAERMVELAQKLCPQLPVF